MSEKRTFIWSPSKREEGCDTTGLISFKNINVIEDQLIFFLKQGIVLDFKRLKKYDDHSLDTGSEEIDRQMIER